MNYICYLNLLLDIKVFLINLLMLLESTSWRKIIFYGIRQIIWVNQLWILLCQEVDSSNICDSIKNILRQEVDSSNMCDSIKNILHQEVDSSNMCDSIKNILHQEVDTDNTTNSIMNSFTFRSACVDYISIYISPLFCLSCIRKIARCKTLVYSTMLSCYLVISLLLSYIF